MCGGMPLRLFKKRYSFPKEGGAKGTSLYAWLFLLSLFFFVLVKILPMRGADDLKREMTQASEWMAQAIDMIRDCRANVRSWQKKTDDINQTGLIGLEFSSLTTSVGQLKAKRTTTNPNFAGLLVMFLKEAGVKRNDTIAIGASGSFPALIIAVLSASKAMDLNPLVLCSLGASQWGSNDPEFHWLNIQDCLLEKGIFHFDPTAFSLGGEKDIGGNMSTEGRRLLREQVEKRDVLFLFEPDLEKNVTKRMEVFEAAACGAEIKAFVNIGGSYPNLGTDPSVLRLKPGVARIQDMPPPEKRGLLFAMAGRGIPVIHLLFIQGLASQYGLPWDPVPLPKPGDGKLYEHIREKSNMFLFLAVVYLVIIASLLVLPGLNNY